MTMKTGEILRRIYERVYGEADTPVEDIRIGICYAGVRLFDDRMGLAATLLSEVTGDCLRFPHAGRLTNSSAADLLRFLLEAKNPIESALGLAAANALLQTGIRGEKDEDALQLMNLTPADRVAMVGFFPPLVPKIKASGAGLTVIERNPARMPLLAEKERKAILRSCTVAVITATALLNGTMEETLQELGNPRHVAVLGPSTPLCLEAFAGTPVTHLGGALVSDTGKTLQVISEGGGTPQMRPYLRFVNLLKGQGRMTVSTVRRLTPTSRA
ncbi:MAG: DUF364 domain-containing protein [Syntrophobacterales bacterium]|jgi:uncharacterized protein (DUF4213/DUF364 family)|nr:DUF364 domain-containing protein [Syntrophobacterales bacterium]